MSGFIFSTNQSATSLNFLGINRRTHQELLSDWSILDWVCFDSSLIRTNCCIKGGNVRCFNNRQNSEKKYLSTEINC
jgi:hypothetical protein